MHESGLIFVALINSLQLSGLLVNLCCFIY